MRAMLVALAILLPSAPAAAFSTDCYGTLADWYSGPPSADRLCTGRILSVLDGATVVLEYENPKGGRSVSRVRLTGWAPCAPGQCPACDEAINKSLKSTETLKSLLGEVVSFRMPEYAYDNAGRLSREFARAMILDRTGQPAINTMIKLGLYCTKPY